MVGYSGTLNISLQSDNGRDVSEIVQLCVCNETNKYVSSPEDICVHFSSTLPTGVFIDKGV